jgi:hypothetical protein
LIGIGTSPLFARFTRQSSTKSPGGLEEMEWENEKKNKNSFVCERGILIKYFFVVFVALTSQEYWPNMYMELCHFYKMIKRKDQIESDGMQSNLHTSLEIKKH